MQPVVIEIKDDEDLKGLLAAIEKYMNDPANKELFEELYEEIGDE